MKTAILLIALCLLTHPGFSAADSSISQKQVETVIASIPTEGEWHAWSQMGAGPRDKWSPSTKAFFKKLGDSRANIRKLDSLVVIGKSISDYPGILSLGILGWDKDKLIYHLYLRTHIDYGDMDDNGHLDLYLGFSCWFNNSMIITAKGTAISMGE